jgi:hypothetical protein
MASKEERIMAFEPYGTLLLMKSTRLFHLPFKTLLAARR